MLVTELIQQREGCAKHILLTVNSNMTVWELIDYVAGKFNRSPLKIQLKRDNKKREITVYDHCKSLG